MPNKIEELSKLYSLSSAQFNQYLNKVMYVITAGKKACEDKTLTIVGGQSGAGKSRLIPVAKRDLNNNAVVVDFDELRSLHPFYKEVSQNYPEITHRILHPDTDKVKNAVLKILIAEKFNVVYEGALRNTEGFLDFAKDFRENDYNINMYIMAVPELESLGSTYLRYATAYLTNSTPRWVEKSAHDGSYTGVIKTTQAFKDKKLVDNINVYVRDEEEPKKIYSTSERQHNDAICAINYGREIGRKKAVEDFQLKYDTVEMILKEKEPEILLKLNDWKELYNNEVEYFKSLNMEGREAND